LDFSPYLNKPRIQVYLARDGLPVGDRQWLFLRKNTDGQIKYAISIAPKQIPFAELIKASTMRWPIEQCFQEGKACKEGRSCRKCFTSQLICEI